MLYNIYVINMGWINSINTSLNNYLQAAGIWGGVLCCLLIIIEPLFPVLPMFIFVTINILVFGTVLGLLISYICAVLGCLLFYIVFNKLLSKKAYKFYKDRRKLNSLVKRYKDIKIETLTTIISMPFTPAFMINLLAAISNMPLKKYMTAEIIAKIFITIFWGFFGFSLIKCLTHPQYLIVIALMLLGGYVLSKLISKKYSLE